MRSKGGVPKRLSDGRGGAGVVAVGNIYTSEIFHLFKIPCSSVPYSFCQ